MESCSLL